MSDTLKTPEEKQVLVADYDEINLIISQIPKDLSLYTEESVQRLISLKVGILWNLDASRQTEVDRMAEELKQGVEGLCYRSADYTEVEKQLERIPIYRHSYTEESYQRVEDARDAVIFGMEIIRQAEVDQMARNLMNAIDGLEKKPYPIYPTVIKTEAEAFSPDENLSLKLSGVRTDLVREIKEGNPGITVVGKNGYALDLGAKEDGFNVFSFTQPIELRISVSQKDLEDVFRPRNLTMAHIRWSDDGYVILDYVGGGYDAHTGTFSVKVDKTGKYLLVEKPGITKITLRVGEKETFLCDREKQIDVAPVIRGDRVLVPLRFIGEALGCRVQWYEADQGISIRDKDKVLTMQIGKEIPGYGQAPVIRSDRTLVPIRYVSESLGANVIYDPSMQEIMITK